jgi:CubicO group peptidase (beta-lactamase class C family)
MRTRKVRRLPPFVLLLLAQPLVAQEQAWQGVLTRLEAQIAQDVATDSVGSIAIAVIDGDRVALARAFGWADRERRVPANANTIYRVGSITKSFTAVALVQAVERGTMALDDPVERLFPAAREFPGRPDGTAPITWRQLASHTAGLIREPELRGAASGPISQWEEKIVASIPTTRYEHAPGARYLYSNIGFGTLGLAVSRAANEPYMDLVRTRILEPLGMTSSGFIVTDAMREHVAAGYANGANGSINAEAPAREHDGRGYKVPNGGLYSTVGDLGRFIAAMSGRGSARIMSESARHEMLRVQTPEDPRSGYGLGFSIATGEDGVAIAGHGGSVSGYTAHIAFDPATGIGVVLLRNYGRGATNLGRTATTTVRELVAARRTGGVAQSPGSSCCAMRVSAAASAGWNSKPARSFRNE